MAFQAVLHYEREDWKKYWSFHRRLRFRLLYAILNGVIVLMSGALLYLCVRMTLLHAWNRETAAPLILYVVMLALWPLLNRSRLNAAWKAFEKRGTMTVSFREDMIVTETENAKEEVQYSAFTELYHTDGAYYLYLSKHGAVVLPERCFTWGDPAAFGAFISQKTGLEIREI